MFRRTAVGLVLALAMPARAAPQLLPPPQDGDIRVVHWELTNQTQVWLTLNPLAAAGKPLPATLTFTISFCGNRPPEPVTQVEVRAQPGLLFSWKPQLALVLDDAERIALAGAGVPYTTIYGVTCDGCTDGVLATITLDTLKRIAASESISGDLLGSEFVLGASQRAALAQFLERARSDNPGRLPEDPFKRLRPCPPTTGEERSPRSQRR